MLLAAAQQKPTTSRAVTEPENGLTDREQEVLQLIANGMNNRDIAAKLVISEKTVKTHVSNILSKLNLDDRTQDAIYALRRDAATDKN